MPLRSRAGRQSKEPATLTNRKRRGPETTARASSDSNVSKKTAEEVVAGSLAVESRLTRAVKGRSLQQSVGSQPKRQAGSSAQTKPTRSARQETVTEEPAPSAAQRKSGTSGEPAGDAEIGLAERAPSSTPRDITSTRLRPRKIQGPVRGERKRSTWSASRDVSDRANDGTSTSPPSVSAESAGEDDSTSSDSTANASSTEATYRLDRTARMTANGSDEGNQIMETPLSIEEQEKRRQALEAELAWFRQEATLLVQVAQMIPWAPQEALKEQLAMIDTEPSAYKELLIPQQDVISSDAMAMEPLRATLGDSLDALEETRDMVTKFAQTTVEKLLPELRVRIPEPLWLVNQFITDLLDLERRRQALQERIFRNYRLQLAYLERYARARFREAQHQCAVSEEVLRERYLEFAFRRRRQRRIAGQLHRDPMVLFGQPPVMIPPGYAGVPYQLLPPRPSRVKMVGQARPLPLPTPESLQLLERRPVGLGLEPNEALEDVRHVQKAITALRRKARASNSGIGAVGGTVGLGAGLGTSAAGKSQSGSAANRTANGSASRPTSTRGRGAGRPAAVGRRGRDQTQHEQPAVLTQKRAADAVSGAPGGGSALPIIESTFDIDDEERRARLAVGLIHRDQAYGALQMKSRDAKVQIEDAGAASGLVRRTASAMNPKAAVGSKTLDTSGTSGAGAATGGGTGARTTSKRGRPRKRNTSEPARTEKNMPLTKPVAKKPPRMPSHSTKEATESSSSVSLPDENLAEETEAVTATTSAPKQHPQVDGNEEQPASPIQKQNSIEGLQHQAHLSGAAAMELTPALPAISPAVTTLPLPETTSGHAAEATRPDLVAPTSTPQEKWPAPQDCATTSSEAGNDQKVTHDLSAAVASAATVAEHPPLPSNLRHGQGLLEFPIGGDPDAFVSRGTLFYRGMQLHKGDQVAIRILPKGSTSGAVYVGLARGSLQAQADVEAAEIFQGPLVSLNVKELHIQDAEHRVYVSWLQSGRAELVSLGNTTP